MNPNKVESSYALIVSNIYVLNSYLLIEKEGSTSTKIFIDQNLFGRYAMGYFQRWAMICFESTIRESDS